MTPETRALIDGITLPMMQISDEIGGFIDWVEDINGRPQHVMEIGAGHGGTTQLLLRWCTGKMYSIDKPSGASSGLDTNNCAVRNFKLLAEAPARFVGTLGDSQDQNVITTVHRLLDLDHAYLDVLFIDGDHHFQGVKNDFILYQSLVRPGGVIAFHDINAEKFEYDGVEVHKFWQWLKSGGEFTMREFSVGADWGGIGAVIR